MILPLISRNSPEVLIFNIDDIKALRERHEILGVLIGTLAQYPQQNFFLSVPLKLFIYEVLWLVENGQGKLVDYLKWRERELNAEVVSSLENDKEDASRTETSISLPKNPPNFIITPNSIEPASDPVLYPVENYIANHLAKTSASPQQFRSYYHNFKHLKSLGYFVNPGLKFGGDLVLYPGDPLKFHSYSIVKFHFVNLQELVVGGRLATGVKKNLIVIDDEESVTDTHSSKIGEEYVESLFAPPKKLAFSVQWAGFG